MYLALAASGFLAPPALATSLLALFICLADFLALREAFLFALFSTLTSFLDLGLTGAFGLGDSAFGLASPLAATGLAVGLAVGLLTL